MIDPNLVTTVSVGELPLEPITTESKIPHELAGILNHSTIAQFIELLAPLVGKMAYEAVTLIVDAEYISNNFDGTGLGINICEGFAIRNGNNGTDNADGRVDIGYGSIYNAVGAIGGSQTHTLISQEMPIHEHLNGVSDDIQNVFVYGGSTTGMPGLATTDLDTGGSSTAYQGRTSQVGGGQAHNNMQPYRVVLKMMKLP